MNLYQSIFKRSDDAILILKGDKIHDCNKSLCDLWGEDFENNIIGHSFERLFSSDYLSSRENVLEKFRAFSNNLSVTEKSIELSVSTSQNKTLFADITFTKLLQNHSGQDQIKQGHYTLVTFKPKIIDRPNEKQLNHTEIIDLNGQKLNLSCASLSVFISQLFEHSPVGIVVNELKSGKFVAVNQAFLAPLQYSKDEVLALSFDDITPEAYRDIDRLVMLDINLPEMTGFELLATLKRYPKFEKVPFIAISANAMKEDVTRGLNSDFNYYLTKPINIKQINQVIDELI